MKIETTNYEQCNTWQAKVFINEHPIDAYGDTEIEALKALFVKVYKKNGTWLFWKKPESTGPKIIPMPSGEGCETCSA